MNNEKHGLSPIATSEVTNLNSSPIDNHVESRRNIHFIHIATFFFFIFSFIDLDVLLLKIPNIDEALVSEGVIKWSPFTGKRGKSLVIATTNGQLVLNCWITSGRDKSCIKKQDNILYLDKPAKAWWYKARVNGFFEEKRLLQLEIDGQLIVNYDEQKEKYLLSKKNHNYLPTILFIISLLLSLSSVAHNNGKAVRH